MLNKQTNPKKEIDVQYANALASDLAKMVIHKQFKETRVWPVDITKLDQNPKLSIIILGQQYLKPKTLETHGTCCH